MPSTVSVSEAVAALPTLIERVRAGESITIAGDGGRPLARLVSAGGPLERPFGVLRGQLTVPDSFFDPLPDDELDAWGA